MQLWEIKEYINQSESDIINKIGEEISELKIELTKIPMHQQRVMEELADVLQSCYTYAVKLDTYTQSRRIVYDSNVENQLSQIELYYDKMKACKEYEDKQFIIRFLRTLYSAAFSLGLKLKISECEMSNYLKDKFVARGLL